MEIALSYEKHGWFADQKPSTGAVFDWNKVLASIMLGVGTGVFTPDIEFCRQILKHDSISNIAIPGLVELNQSEPSTTIFSPKHQMEQICKVFSPAISELAIAFGVSRQTIYNWLNDKPVDSIYLDKLQDIASAAEIFAESGIPMTGWLLKRKIIEGKKLLEFVRDGGSAQKAVNHLVEIVRIESEQRKRIDARLAGRKKTSFSPESDFPSENDIRG